MTGRGSSRLLALPPAVLTSAPGATIRDVAAALEPDAVWVLGPTREPPAFASARRTLDVPVVHPPLESDHVTERRIDPNTERSLAVLSRASALTTAPTAIAEALSTPATAGLVCTEVMTAVEPTALETTLNHAEALATALPTTETTPVLSGGLPADYDERWHLEPETGRVLAVDEPSTPQPDVAAQSVTIRLQGAGPVAGYRSEESVALLSIGDDGIEQSQTYATADFGLQAVTGLGPKTAERLADRGVRTRADLLERSVATLADLEHVGRDRARTMLAHAAALECGEPRRLTDDSLPGQRRAEPPLCLDIETDGLSPTIIWQVGVYDPATDEHRAFVERDDPSDPGPVLEALLDWLLGVHPDRALLTWNGWRFDYRHLTRFVGQHVPYYADAWAAIPKYDLYDWAVRKRNAVLPGRTNTLTDVARALGYEDAETGLDGAQTAAAYQRFMRGGDPLDWDRHEDYCEDDCRALWRVYAALRDAPRATVEPTRKRDGGEESADTARTGPTTQTGLGEF